MNREIFNDLEKVMESTSKASTTKEMLKTNITYECRKDELMCLPVGRYKVVIDLKEDNIIVTNERMKKSWKKIEEISVLKDTKKAREDAARKVRIAVEKLKKICKTTVVKTLGKDAAEKAPVWQYNVTPYYKCAYPMQLYLEESMIYLYGGK